MVIMDNGEVKFKHIHASITWSYIFVASLHRSLQVLMFCAGLPVLCPLHVFLPVLCPPHMCFCHLCAPPPYQDREGVGTTRQRGCGDTKTERVWGNQDREGVGKSRQRGCGETK